MAHVWEYYLASAQGLVLNSIKRYNNSQESRRKAASRAMFIVNFISYIIANDYRIDEKVWNEVSIYAFPRAFRFDEDQSKPFSEDEWLGMFDYLKTKSNFNINYVLNDRNLLLKLYGNRMQICMQNIVAKAIKEELGNK